MIFTNRNVISKGCSFASTLATVSRSFQWIELFFFFRENTPWTHTDILIQVVSNTRYIFNLFGLISVLLFPVLKFLQLHNLEYFTVNKFKSKIMIASHLLHTWFSLLIPYSSEKQCFASVWHTTRTLEVISFFTVSCTH